MSEKDWYLVEQGRQVGPISRQALIDQLRRHGHGPDTLVWNASMTDWTRAGDTELAEIFRGPPPVGAAHPPRPTGPAVSGPYGQIGDPSPAVGRMATAAPVGDRWVPFGEAFSRFWQKFATFQGRASRSEYWWAVLGVVLISFALSLVDLALFSPSEMGGGLFAGLFSLATLIPGIAVGVRRLHDTDRSGWWLLIGFVPLIGFVVLLVFFCLPSNDGPNRFGP